MIIIIIIRLTNEEFKIYTIMCADNFRTGEGPVKIPLGKPHDGDRSVSPNRVLLRKKDNKQVTSRDEKTASIRSYPKRLSPSILSVESYNSLAGTMRCNIM